MAACLTDPEHGYYTSRDPLGAAGDFTTAPEISQMFGELVGLWCLALAWQIELARGWRLLELGPGRGTLMADTLRAMAQTGPDGQVPPVDLVETSPVLRDLQRDRLAGRDVTWHDGVETLPRDIPYVAIANEFFDALPIRQFVASPAGWRERLIARQDGRFVPMVAETAADDALVKALPDAPNGRIAEVAQVRQDMMTQLARHIVRNGGAALIIDFGDPRLPLADTLQAVRGHEQTDRFDAPGGADLATAVDFADLAGIATANGAGVHGPVGQGPFLRALGIDHRARMLLESASAEQADAIARGHERLVSLTAMGDDFRVMAVTQSGVAPPPGFEGTIV
ncbi:MAG: SAM-dependent methyltransferase [Rhodospirillales bacterium]|nr:SAM-dependent methyltransferase [Rhodospirillales bacterium]